MIPEIPQPPDVTSNLYKVKVRSKTLMGTPREHADILEWMFNYREGESPLHMVVGERGKRGRYTELYIFAEDLTAEALLAEVAEWLEITVKEAREITSIKTLGAMNRALIPLALRHDEV